MKIKQQKNTLIFIIIAVFFIAFCLKIFIFNNKESLQTASLKTRQVASEIIATGSVRSENEATMRFQTGGKLVYLPFKEGDKVYKGQTIAQLDSYVLQKQLTAALNNYRIIRDTFDQTQDNAKSGVLKGAQTYSLQVLNKGGFAIEDVIGDIIKRILDQNQATLDNSVINVEITNYALQLATLTSPIDGIIYRQDVTTPFINITPTTSFTVIDPSTLIFRANISENDIDFVNVGSLATIQIDALKGRSFAGIVTRIYPGKITLPNGQHVYQVDIQSEDLKLSVKYDQAGSVIIKNSMSNNVTLVPNWTILGNKYIWVVKDNKPILKEVKIGKTHGENVEILDGLSEEDRIIISPKSLAVKKYQIL